MPDCEFFMIDRENMPCIYELSFDPENVAIIVRVHPDFLASWPENLGKCPMVNHLAKSYKFSKFDTGGPGQDFGFEAAFKRIPGQNGFATFMAAIPPIKTILEKTCQFCSGDGKSFFGVCEHCVGKGKVAAPCERCNGTKEDNDGCMCLECAGSGVQKSINWHKADAISASFTVLFGLASWRNKKEEATSSEFPQLILVNTITRAEQHGGSIDGTYSVPLAEWFRTFPAQFRFSKASDVALVAWEKMFMEIDEFDAHNFYAEIADSNGWLNISVAGDRCSLYPSHSFDLRRGRGYSFSCHNVDTAAQQIAFLCTLSALCDMARKEIRF